MQEQEKVISEQSSVVNELESQIKVAQSSLREAEAKVTQRTELENERNAAREKQAAMKVENETLKVDMNQLKERIDALKSAEGATCPLCGQELSEEHRKSTLNQLEEEGKQKGDHYRANQSDYSELAKQITDYELQITKLSSAENERIRFTSEISQLTERLGTLQFSANEWETAGKKRLKEVEKLLESEKYAIDEQKQLARIDKELAKLGYDAATHDEMREKENELRSVEE